MDIGAIAAQQQTAASQAGTKLAQDFDTFLVLLTAQLQHQDPLEPLDSNEFTAQLVQFTGVEQSIATNRNLETLVGLLSAQSENGLFSYIGQKATAFSATVNLNGTNQPEWVYDLGANAAESKLIIEDATGKTVAEFDGAKDAGRHSFIWSGIDRFGERLPSGRYTLKVEAKTVENVAVASDIFVRGTVQGVERTPQGPLLSIDGTFVFPNQITTVGDLHSVASTTSSGGDSQAGSEQADNEEEPDNDEQNSA